MDKGLCRILHPSGQPLGVGFLADERHILTCAHVVTTALGIDITTANAPETPVEIDFPLSHDKTTYQADVVAWLPYEPNKAGDIACLTLQAPPPSDTAALTIISRSTLWGLVFRAFGVPQNFDNGVYAEGKIMGRQSTGYFQAQGTNPVGYRLQPGFSGGPIWSDDQQAVVGILSLADVHVAHAGFVIPGRMLLDTLAAATQPTIGQQFAAAPPQSLADLAGLNPSELGVLWQTYLQRIQAATPHPDDVQAAIMLSLLQSDFDTAERLTTTVGGVPKTGYVAYLVALALLRGQRPAVIQQLALVKTLLQHLDNAAMRLPDAAHIHILRAYVREDYFQQWGMRIPPPTPEACRQAALHSPTDETELYTLAQLLPDLRGYSLYQTILQKTISSKKGKR